MVFWAHKKCRLLISIYVRIMQLTLHQTTIEYFNFVDFNKLRQF